MTTNTAPAPAPGGESATPGFTIHRRQEGEAGKILEIDGGWAPPTTNPGWVRRAVSELLAEDHRVVFDADHDTMQAVPGLDATWLVGATDADGAKAHWLVNLALGSAVESTVSEVSALDREQAALELSVQAWMNGGSTGMLVPSLLAAGAILLVLATLYFGISALLGHPF